MIPAAEKLLLAYARWFPMKLGKYRIVERFGRGGKDDFVRRAQLKYGGYSMDCDLRKMLQRQFYYFGTYFLEERVISHWTEYAKNAGIVFDIGANAGIYSLAAAGSNSRAAVHAFEPTPEIVAHLDKTVKQNGLVDRLHVHSCAVARETGTAHLNFFSGEHDDNEGMNFVTHEGRNSKSIAVPTVSLDDFCAQREIATIDLVKIDVQGNEPDVLAGASELIRRRALRTIFFELNWNHEDPANCPASQAVKILGEAGYQFADPNGRMKFQAAGPWLHSLSDVVAFAGTSC